MLTDTLMSLKPGTILRLKDHRAAAYGEVNPLVRFDWIKPRPGYSVPWVVGYNMAGKLGYYHPSDFAMIMKLDTV